MDNELRNTLGTLLFFTVVYVFIKIIEYRHNKRRNRYITYKGK
jgi:hypothetical protein